VGLAAAFTSTLALAGAGAAAANAVAKPQFTPANPASKLGGITLGVGDQAGTGAEAILESAGLFKASGGSTTSGALKDGLKVTFNDTTSGPLILEAIESGADQIGGVGNAPPVFADATAANDLVIVGDLAQSASAYSLLVNPKNTPGITSIQQLEGKTIGAASGTALDYHFLTILKLNGLSASSVNIDKQAPNNCVALLNSGAIQACDTSSPFTELGEEEGDTDLYSGPKYGSPYSYQVASGKALKNPKYVLAIRDYLTELDQAYDYVHKHELNWAQSWSTFTGLPLNVMKAATLDDQYVPIPVTSKAVTQEQSLVNAFAGDGEIPAKYNVAKFVTSAFSDSVSGKWPATTTTKKK
jgi:sulfonate transport system substrate-binding protein